MAEPFKWDKPDTPKADDGGKGDIIAGVGSSAHQKIKDSIARNVEFNKSLASQNSPVNTVRDVKEITNTKDMIQSIDDKLIKIRLMLKTSGMDSQQQEKAFVEIKTILTS